MRRKEDAMHNGDFDEAWGRIDIWHRALPFSDQADADGDRTDALFRILLCIVPGPRENYGHAHRN